MGIREDWKRIVAWGKANFPRAEFRVARGAAKREVDALEKRLGLSLPEDFRESWRTHNGTAWTQFAYIGSLLTVDEIGRQWTMRNGWQQETGWGLSVGEIPRKIEGSRIKPVWWNPLRIDVTNDGAGNGLALDLDPAKGGTRGQVIHYDHEVGPRWVYAPSWGSLLKQIADDAEAGKWVYQKGGDWGRTDVTS